MSSATVVITGNTVTNNTAPQYAGVYFGISGGSLSFESNLVATNTTTSPTADTIYLNTADGTLAQPRRE